MNNTVAIGILILSIIFYLAATIDEYTHRR